MKPQHKLLILFSLLLCAAMALLQSCTYEKKLAKWCARCPSKDSVITEIKQSIIERIDTSVIQIPADSAWYYALIECIQDSSKKFVPVILNSDRLQGNRTRVNVSLTNGSLKVDCKALEDSIAVLTKRSHRTDSLLKSQSKVIVTPCPDCTPTKFIKFLTWTGGIFWLLLILYILFRIGWFIFKLTPYGAAFNVPSVLSRFVK